MKVSDADIKKRIILAGMPSQTADSKFKDYKRYDELLGKGQLEKEENFDGPASHDTLMICYSSGTTSKSKGVEVCELEQVQMHDQYILHNSYRIGI